MPVQPTPAARTRASLGIWTLLLVAACSSSATRAPEPSTTASLPTAAASFPTATTSAVACPTPAGSIPHVSSVPGDFPELDQTTYWVDPDFDPCTPLRVLYTIPGAGWLGWFGSFKPEGDRHVGVSIVDVTNVVIDGCQDHRLADPPVGRSVDDLARALAELEPFVVTSPPSAVAVHGHSGKYLELQLPGTTDLSACVNNEVISWDSTILSYPFHGYFLGLIEEFWILDVEGSRLAIIANRAPDSPPADVAEMRALLDSIEIEP